MYTRASALVCVMAASAFGQFEQSPNAVTGGARSNFNHANTDRFADNFTLAAPLQVSTITWWGNTSENGVAGDPPSANLTGFYVRVFEGTPPDDRSGSSNRILLADVTFNAANTGDVTWAEFDGDDPVGSDPTFAFTLELPATLNLNAGTQYWISVLGKVSDGSGDFFEWTQSDDGDSTRAVDERPVFDDNTTDLFQVIADGVNFSFRLEEATVLDSDGDLLEDSVETNTGIFIDANDTGTDPSNPDTDGDLLEDGEEVNNEDYLLNPNEPDTDFDGWDDYREVIVEGTDPTNVDTDGDLLEDPIDPDPLTPNDLGDFIEQSLRDVAGDIKSLDTGDFAGHSYFGRRVRQVILAAQVYFATCNVRWGYYDWALWRIHFVIARTDGMSPPSDWVMPSPEAQAISAELEALADLIVILAQ